MIDLSAQFRVELVDDRIELLRQRLPDQPDLKVSRTTSALLDGTAAMPAWSIVRARSSWPTEQ